MTAIIICPYCSTVFDAATFVTAPFQYPWGEEPQLDRPHLLQCFCEDCDNSWLAYDDELSQETAQS